MSCLQLFDEFFLEVNLFGIEIGLNFVNINVAV